MLFDICAFLVFVLGAGGGAVLIGLYALLAGHAPITRRLVLRGFPARVFGVACIAAGVGFIWHVLSHPAIDH
jgi:hypothetical protein